MAAYLILIIDDDPTQHVILDKYLKLSGYDVIHAQDGAEGLVMLDAHKPGLVLLDVQMPELDGFQTLTEIRKKAANRNVAVLMLTALDRRHLKIKGLELGADDYITKPFDRAELLARINAVLRRSDRQRNLEGIMEGDLADVGLSDLLQSMEYGSKTAIITFGEMDGKIAVKDGEMIYARHENHSGDAAMLRLFLLEKGYFSINFNETPGRTESDGPRQLTSVLMNVLNDVDEIKDMIRQLKVENRFLKIVGDITNFPALKPLENSKPMTIMEMIVKMDGHPGQNIKQLIAASKKRLLKIDR